jgi:hypothetical protein
VYGYIRLYYRVQYLVPGTWYRSALSHNSICVVVYWCTATRYVGISWLPVVTARTALEDTTMAEERRLKNVILILHYNNVWKIDH